MRVKSLRRRVIARRRAARGSPGGRALSSDGSVATRAAADRGAVTAEIAAALPALVLVLVAALWTLSLGLMQLRCADAAREAARAAARGDDPAVVRQIAEAVAPDGAVIEVTERDGLVIVEVAVDVRAPVPFSDHLPAPRVSAESIAVEELP
ncbi:MAG TPA: TadE family type IV pilus minor pilin [Jiangellaceae bacterium]